MRYLIAPDSFKGTLSSERVAQIISDAVRVRDSEARIVMLPLADGGEGTLRVLKAALHAEERRVRVRAMLGKDVEVSWLALSDGRTAFIESASCLGLPQIPEENRDPSRYDSFGLGRLLRHVIDKGFGKIHCALGGTATNDCGIGFARALGYRMIPDETPAITDVPAQLYAVAAIKDESGIDWHDITTFALTDVSNPLLGELGCTRIFGPQKGVRSEQFEAYENALRHFSNIVKKDVRFVDDEEPGCGAAGGLGFALRAFCNAKIVSGSGTILRLLGFDEQLQACDVVITGEGRIDDQSVSGKVVGAVAEAANACGKPVTAFCGASEGDTEHLKQRMHLADIISLIGSGISLQDAIQHAEEGLYKTAVSYFENWPVHGR